MYQTAFESSPDTFSYCSQKQVPDLELASRPFRDPRWRTWKALGRAQLSMELLW